MIGLKSLPEPMEVVGQHGHYASINVLNRHYEVQGKMISLVLLHEVLGDGHVPRQDVHLLSRMGGSQNDRHTQIG